MATIPHHAADTTVANAKHWMDMPIWSSTPSHRREAKPFMYKGIAISGKMCAGKTTLAQAISQAWGIPVKGFAEPLKADVASALYEANLAYDENRIIPDLKPRLRGMLQDWGQIFRHCNGADYWVQRRFPDGWKPMVLDDMRFKNEFLACQRRGILTVRLEVSPMVQAQRIERDYPATTFAQRIDQSETDLDNMTEQFDVVIDRAGTASHDALLRQFFGQAQRFQFVFPSPKPGWMV